MDGRAGSYYDLVIVKKMVYPGVCVKLDRLRLGSRRDLVMRLSGQPMRSVKRAVMLASIVVWRCRCGSCGDMEEFHRSSWPMMVLGDWGVSLREVLFRTTSSLVILNPDTFKRAFVHMPYMDIFSNTKKANCGFHCTLFIRNL
jgi:hypothetical protein